MPSVLSEGPAQICIVVPSVPPLNRRSLVEASKVARDSEALLVLHLVVDVLQQHLSSHGWEHRGDAGVVGGGQGESHLLIHDLRGGGLLRWSVGIGDDGDPDDHSDQSNGDDRRGDHEGVKRERRLGRSWLDGDHHDVGVLEILFRGHRAVNHHVLSEFVGHMSLRLRVHPLHQSLVELLPPRGRGPGLNGHHLVTVAVPAVGSLLDMTAILQVVALRTLHLLVLVVAVENVGFGVGREAAAATTEVGGDAAEGKDELALHLGEAEGGGEGDEGCRTNHCVSGLSGTDWHTRGRVLNAKVLSAVSIRLDLVRS
mmetsp:Transcript_15080/g.32480  ORF Transcript_15080/g.32480 Transcript_15080/m.32480 type:complete len:313 (+) Transcript_15080:144-1082(+)